MIVAYVGMLAQPLQKIRAELQDLQHATASIGRVNELLRMQPHTGDSMVGAQSQHNLLALPAGPLAVGFENVSFAYNDEARKTEDEGDAGLLTGSPTVLQSVTFRLQPGRVLGVLGRTGSGKSTMARLLLRLYDTDIGTVELGETHIRGVSIGELRNRVALVTQDVQLFQASLRNNLTLFNPRIGDGEVERALRELRLWDWAATLPQGLDTSLSAGGGGVSAGEAQLVAFARAFLKDPGLVILDEASSRLDPATETLLEGAIDRLFRGRTGIVIAHRLRTVQRADDILILEAGRVAEYGPRERLAADPGSRFSSLLRTGLEEVLA
jgi:ABC-type multidrug transport system fused ATPase/permease subunit